MSNKKTNNSSNKNSGNSQDKDNFNWGRASKTSLIWLVIVMGAIYLSGQLTNLGKKEVEIEFTEYKDYLKIMRSKEVLLLATCFMVNLKFHRI